MKLDTTPGSLLTSAMLLCLLCGCASLRTTLLPVSDGAAWLADAVTISRDEWNVPHVHGETDASVAFGAAYAQAEDDYRGIEEIYIHALGRAAYWYGERYLANDVIKTAFEVERLSREEYAREPPERQALWSAFAAGLNAWAEASGVERRVISRWEPWMLFAVPRTMDAETVVGGVTLGALAGLPVVPAAAADSGIGVARALAAAPARTGDGHALLLQRVESGGGRPPYEMHLHSVEGWHVTGVVVPGTPLPRQGHNERIAWAWVPDTAPAGRADTILFDHPTDSLMYRDGEAWLRAEEWRDTILVNTAGGVVPREYRFRRTARGPVVTGPDGAAVAVSVAANQGGSLQQWLALGRAADLAGFTAAFDADAAGGSVVYADVAGNIARFARPAEPGGSSIWSNPPGGVLSEGYADDTADSAPPDTLQLTVVRLTRLAFEPRLGDAEDEIRRLVLEWEQVGGGNPARAMRLDAWLDMLRAWDRVGAADSEARTLYVVWQEVRRTGYYGAYSRLRAFEDAIAALEQEWGSARVTWSDVDRRRRAAALERGGAWISVTQLGPAVRSYSLSASGADSLQAELFFTGSLRSSWFQRDDVVANARRVYRPGEPAVR
ncbi:MAG: penicillin acylase family protein [Gemmatimonadota bacterium]